MWLFYPNDFELLYYCLQNDEWALRTLVRKYTPYSRKIVKESLNGYKVLEMFKDDFVLEALLAITDAIHCYRDQKECKFGTFFYQCALRRVKTLLRHHLRESNQINLYSISLDVFPTEDDNVFRYKGKALEDWRSPNYCLDYKEASLRVQETIQRLSDTDKRVLDLYLLDYTYAEASQIIGKSVKNYDNRVQKIKKLIKKKVYLDTKVAYK